MLARCALLLLLSGCSTIEGLETSAISRFGSTPLIVPIIHVTWAPLCHHAPLLFWRKPLCAI